MKKLILTVAIVAMGFGLNAQIETPQPSPSHKN